jgi:hypothetical protein
MAVPTCPNCQAPVIDWQPYGRCKQCKEPFSAEFDAQMEAVRRTPQIPSLFGPQRAGRPAATPTASTVVIADIHMPFGSMVVFMIKWALASIPAFLILAVLAFIVLALFGGLAGVVALRPSLR